MYKVLIADDDILMRKALSIMISSEGQFNIVQVVDAGEEAVRLCKEENVDILFMSAQLPGLSGIQASRIIHQSNKELAIYLISTFATSVLIRGEVKDCVKDIIEKPITHNAIKKILGNYKTEHEVFVNAQLEELMNILKNRDFKQFYMNISRILDEIYEMARNDSQRLIKIFNYVGQNLLDTRNICQDDKINLDVFPINEGLILDQQITEQWLFRVIDYLFQQNSINRYPLLENIFLYITKNIKNEITLNSIIEECAISQGYLSRIFREQFQISVMEYLHMKKIHLAKGYFYFTSESIAEVAFRLGYNESSYFSKVFKKYESMTVKQYKNSVCKK